MIKGLKYERAEPGEVDESAGWHVPGRKIEHFEGIIGKVKIHPEKRTLFEEKATSFCSTVRAIATLLIKDKPPGKPTLMKRFSLSGREYNLALSRATGMIESAKTLTANRKETIDGNISSLKEKIEETGTDIADLTELQKSLYKQRRNKKVTIKKKAEITKRLERNYITLYKSRQKRCFLKARLIRAERKLADIPKQPHIFMFGKAAYHNQPDYKKITPDGRTAWRSEWQNARNSMFGARGSSDEVGGNSTYRIVFSGVSIKVGNYLGRLTPSTAYNFSICHGKHGIIGKFTLSEKEGRVLQNILIKNNAPIKKTMTEGKIKKGVSVMRADISERTPLKVSACSEIRSFLCTEKRSLSVGFSNSRVTATKTPPFSAKFSPQKSLSRFLRRFPALISGAKSTLFSLFFSVTPLFNTKNSDSKCMSLSGIHCMPTR